MRGPRTDGRYALLDVLRFIVAMGVVVYHLLASPSAMLVRSHEADAVPGALTAAAGYGWIGVYVFFVISGFVIALSGSRQSLPQYVGARVGRILPAYWFTVIVTVLLLWALPWGFDRPSVAVAIANFSMVQGQFGIPNLQVPFWTLLVELKFYVIFGLLVLRNPSAAKVTTVALAWPIVGFAAAFAQGIVTGPAQTVFAALNGFLIPQYAAFFGLGIGIWLLRQSPKWGYTSLAVNCGLSAYWFRVAVADNNDLQRVPLSWGVSYGLLALGVVAVWLAVRVSVGAVVSRAGHALGRWSYPLYLVHFVVGNWVVSAIDIASPVVQASFGVAVSLLLAIFVNQFVEMRWSRPLRDAVTGWLSRWPTGHQARERSVARQ